MVLEKLEQFGYKTKSVQWWKLLNVAYQNKFQFKLWPDGVHPVGPDFNCHTLSAQHLKLLIMSYIKCRATQYYDTELKTEATNLLELRHKQGHSDKTLDDIIDELDVTVSEIDIVPWPQDHIDQCENDNPRMFDIPLVTSTSHIMLHKLADSEKFKYSIPKTLLEQYKEATSTSGLNVGPPSEERQREDTTCDCQPQQQTHHAAHGFSVVHKDHHSNNDLPHTEHHPADYDQTFESEADSLNAPDSRIRKKLKVVRYDGAPHIVPAHPHPRPHAPIPGYEPPQHWRNEVWQMSPQHVQAYGHNVAHSHHDFLAAGPSRVVARGHEKYAYGQNTPSPDYGGHSYDRDFDYHD
ncbi:uncharacterized protein BJ212DRAFT_1480876 [Suillus subaureus]|uniref:Uncharacterized protein n=1 Tax=Suillus subaureus TaxID=48587 RepID=A0A9P7JDA9_9AGAM|nr:uncharacterized protein BJ212DRAFT_1480876 [Suillus subaureus]KAG1816428.1 hypothetical protein BJ212DRAFT_1480876 [Suillus subaureus]